MINKSWYPPNHVTTIEFKRKGESMDNTYSKYIKKAYPENLFCTILETDHYDIDEDYILALNHVLKQLPERTQQILNLRYKERISLSKIGQLFSITNQRIRSIIENTCKILRLYKHKTYLVNGYKKGREEVENMKIHGIKAMYDLPISCLEISHRSIRQIGYTGIRTIGELVDFINQRGEEWHHKIRNIGKASKEEMERELKGHGFKLFKD
jgi:predicted DNA-binding protein YlxM (UPF0122 family)